MTAIRDRVVRRADTLGPASAALIPVAVFVENDSEARPMIEKRRHSMQKIRTLDEYFCHLPKETRVALEGLRKAIREAAPQAEETISYNIPAFKWNGMLVWYAAFKNHIGFYPKASAIASFHKELAAYKTSKGAIQLPIGTRIPVGLVKKIVKFRLKENQAARGQT
jgi:uncharacterized protein YdhG (YjbR/CyaY superfamily)